MIVEVRPVGWHVIGAQDLPSTSSRACSARLPNALMVIPRSPITHLARLPGFPHQKGEPFMTRIVEANDLPSYGR